MGSAPRFACFLLSAVALAACGSDNGGESADESTPTSTWVSLPTDPADANFDEPELPPGAQICSDVRAGNRFVAFRVFAEGVSCDEAEGVAKAEGEDGAPSEWSCIEIQGTFVQCENGEALVGFNSG